MRKNKARDQAIIYILAREEEKKLSLKTSIPNLGTEMKSGSTSKMWGCRMDRE